MSEAKCILDQKLFNRNVAKYVLETGSPFNTCEKASFRQIYDDMNIHVGTKKLKHTSRRSLVRNSECIHTKNMQELDNLLKNVAYISTTADIWTSKKRRILGCTMNWIDPETCEMRTKAIACKRFPGSHTGQAIADQLMDIYSIKGLDLTKLVATVTDNGSNFNACFGVFGIDPKESLFLKYALQESDDAETFNAVEFNDLELPLQLKCAAHCINLIATTDFIAGIKSSADLWALHDSVMKKCTLLWKQTRSFKNNEIITSLLGTALKIPVITRWNSAYDCLRQIVVLRDKILELSTILDISDPLINDDYEYINIYIKCTRPTATALNILQGNVPYGYLLPTLLNLKKFLTEIRNGLVGDQEIFFPLIDSQLNGIEKRFNECLKVENRGVGAAIASYFHPKFKNTWLKRLDSHLQNKIRKLVKDVAFREINYSINICNKSQENENITDGILEIGIPQRVLDCENIENLISAFIRDPRQNLMMLNEYPLIKHLFLKYNTPTPSSAAVERLFSYVTMLSIPKYNRLNDINFEIKVLSMANAKQ